VLLAASIGCEVGGTLLLHASRGFTVLVPSLGVLGGYAVSILLFSRALQHGLTLGIAYGTLTGCGLAMATLASALFFDGPLSGVQLVGLALILVGAVLLQTRPETSAAGA
jgi:small multidrug resistance pump